MAYGTGTRSYNRSPEKRQMDRERAQATAAFASKPQPEVILPIECHCSAHDVPHLHDDREKYCFKRGLLGQSWRWAKWQAREPVAAKVSKSFLEH